MHYEEKWKAERERAALNNGLVNSQQNCCGGKRKLLWQFTVAIKSDPVNSGRRATRLIFSALRRPIASNGYRTISVKPTGG